MTSNNRRSSVSASAGFLKYLAVAVTAAGIQLPVSAQIEIAVDTTTAGLPRNTEPAALSAVKSLVARAGSAMSSTEFGSYAASAPAPPQIRSVDEAEIRQAARDGADLIRILGLVPTKDGPRLGSELDRELFEQEEKARELLGDNPTVVYRIKLGEETLPDPMIVPWIEGALRLQDRFEQAVNLIAGNKLMDARRELLDISTAYPDSEWGVQAATLLKKLDNLREDPKSAITEEKPKTVEITLDGPVKPTTMLFDSVNPAQSRVMILGRAYRVGQSIRQHPDHFVKEIRASEIDIEVRRDNVTKVFTISVRPSAGQ
jgi:hypothetical protein